MNYPTYATAAMVAACLVLAGCQVERTPPGAEAPDEEAFVEIPLDDVPAGTEASLARNFYFIFDGSGSMRDEPTYPCREDQHFRSKLEGARWAVLEFLTKIPEDVAIGLYLFDQRGEREVVALGTGNRREFLAAVDGIDAGSGTPLADAIEFGTDRLVEQYKQQLGYGEFRLVVVTDGQADKIPAAARYATRYGIPIYAIGLCIEQDHPLRQYAVSYRAADSFDDLARGLEQTLAEMPAFDVTEFTPQ